LQVQRPDISAAGVKDNMPSSDKAGAFSNRFGGEELQAMLNDTVSASPTPAEMSVAQVLLYGPEFSSTETLGELMVYVGA
jgi:hypothetical protein